MGQQARPASRSVAVTPKAEPEDGIFLNVKDEQRGPFAKPQVLSMWNNGLITSDAVYWYDGMPDWLPISELIKEVTASEPAPPPTSIRSVASTPKSSAVSVSNLMELAKAAADANNPKEAYRYYTKVLEHDPRSAIAWVGKGEAAGWMSTVQEIKTTEMVSAFNNAMNFASEEENPVLQKNCADAINRVTSACYAIAREHATKFFVRVPSVWPDYVKTCALLLSALEIGNLYDPDNQTTIENIIHISADNIKGIPFDPGLFGITFGRVHVTKEYEAKLRSKIDEYAVKMYRLNPGYVKPRV